MNLSRQVHGWMWWAGVTPALVLPGGCGRTQPGPPPGPPPVEEPAPPAAEPAPPKDEPSEPEAEPEPVFAPPSVPAEALAGDLDGRPFVLAQATLEGSVLTLVDAEQRSVSIVMFRDQQGSIDLTAGEIPFGSPHVVVRTGASSASAYTDGYRLLLNLESPTAGMWLELPDGRGTLAGRFRLP